ncbi:hypothetical protein JZ751_028587 [Albula glossodonta]|uniref:Integral membrane protein 2 n=1 Tax=Albula glossodonta TaxID=121402 RepID=A0A8T2NMD5_9TELE|nr:hypothetical protein JZ751_028587 [Albula glossodonta]
MMRFVNPCLTSVSSYRATVKLRSHCPFVSTGVVDLTFNFVSWPEASTRGRRGSNGGEQRKGTYLPQTYLIQEEMVVTGRIRNMRQLGAFIYRLCNGKDTFRLKRRTSRRLHAVSQLSAMKQGDPVSSHSACGSCVLTECTVLSGGLAGIDKRGAQNCHRVRHFENTFVVETTICDAA